MPLPSAATPVTLVTNIAMAPDGASFVQLFEAQVQQMPEQIALRYADQQLSYEQLNQQANQLAHCLRQHGCRPERLVGLCLPRSLDSMVALLAILKAGAAYLPLDPAYPPARLRYMLADARPHLVLSSSTIAGSLLLPADNSTASATVESGVLPPSQLCLDQLALDSYASSNLPACQSPQHLAYVIYTSGSTGQAKGTQLCHAGLLNLIRAQQQAFALAPGARVLQFASLNFDASIWEIVMALAVGATLCLASNEQLLPAAALQTTIQHHAITHLTLPPVILAMLEPAQLATVQTLIVAGEACPPALAAQWAQGRRFFNAYGPTESTVCASLFDCAGLAAQSLPSQLAIGHAIHGIRLQVLDAALNPVPVGEIGQLAIGGAGLARGYLGRAALTAEKFIPDPDSGVAGARLYLSGDLASWQADGNLVFHGRIDQQIKLRGMRIEPGEIEAALCAMPWVQQACVLAHPASSDGQGSALGQSQSSGQPPEQQLVAWVVADYPAFGDSQARQNDNTAHWGQASDDIYQGASATDARFNISGWYSSYDRSEIPAHEMQEWVAQTVDRIRALQPRRILEIGCGAGLLLHRLAPDCSRYHGVDLSPVVIAQLQAQLAQDSYPACRISLTACAADAVAQGLTEQFDVVIINSVAQYFPSLDYLDQVLQAALTLLDPDGGQIFIGDVRHLGLHQVFHTALALHQARAQDSLAQISSAVARSMAMETELLLDPRYFLGLQQQIPAISQVQILPKLGQARNELTKFRYDVVLTLATAQSQAPQRQWQAWQSNTSLATIDALLAQQPEYLALSDAPDQRITAENSACQALKQLSPQQTVADLEATLRASANAFETSTLPAPAPTLEQLSAVGQAHGYTLSSSVAAGEQGGLHLLWQKSSRPADWRACYSEPVTPLANIPSLWQLQQAMRQQIIAQLQQVLPHYMVPGQIVFVPQMPLNANGKIDRQALPVPDLAQNRTAYQGARNPDEQTMVDIWSAVLKLPQIGIHDDFFALGGHSLLATQVISRVRQAFQVDISLRTLFAAPVLLALLQQVQAISANNMASSTAGLDRVQVSHAENAALLPDAQVPLASRDQPLPLSFAQQRLWFLDQLDSSDISYHIPLALGLRGALDHSALQRAIQAIVARHEVLRTCLVVTTMGDSGEAQPAQVIAPELTLAMPLIDLRSLDPAQQQEQLEQLLQQQSAARFDLTRGPLLRLSLVRLGAIDPIDPIEPHHVLLLTMHHLISDGWSMALWAHELGCFYQAELSGQPTTLPPLVWQYADFAQWQRQWLQGERLQQQVSYWRQRLAGAPELLNLPLDHVRPARPSPVGASVDFCLPPALLASLHALSRQHQASLFMTLCAALQLLLARYSGQNDICIGTPIANRHHAQVENLIGFFVNTLVLRSQVDLAASFTQLLQQVRHHTLDAYAHQDLPFEQLVEALQPQRHLSHTPLFQVMLVLHNTPPNVPVLPGLQVEWLELASVHAKFDLTLSLTETAQGLQGRWEYRCDLFEAASVARMAQHFSALLQAIVEQPQAQVGQLGWISQAERQQLIHDFNPAPGALVGTDWQQFASLQQRFEAQVARFPERIAVQLEQSCLSYQQLNQRANQLAHYLLAQGVVADTLVALCLERTPELLVAILAILKAGGAYVPLDPNYPAERLAYMLDDAQPLLLLTSSAVAAQLNRQLNRQLEPQLSPQLDPIAGACRRVCLDTIADELENWPPHNPALPCGPQQLAYVIYTSGSTGKPKGTQLAHQNVLRLFAHSEAWFGFDQHDVWTLFHSCAFDFSVWEIWGALLYGARLLIVPYHVARSPEQMHALLQAQGVTILNQTPTAFQQLVQADAACQHNANWRLRHIIFGGEALNLASLAPWFARYGAQQPALSNMYGITETTVHVTFQRLQLHSTRPLAIGRPIADLQVYILDEYWQPVPIGVPGQLFVAGAGLARGYLNRPDLTAERFIPNPFATASNPGARLYQSGDLARYLSDGSIEYLGRIDQQVKIRGFRIELGEIEAAMTALPADSWPGGTIAEAVVLARNDLSPRADSTLVAYYVLAQAKPDQSHALALRTALLQMLPDYMVPSHFVAMSALPLTANGKVDRKALPLPAAVVTPVATALTTAASTSLASGASAAFTPQQQLMCQIWAGVLQCPLVGLDDDFFALGGHSLLATQLISRIRVAFEVELPLRTLFEAPTVASLLHRMAQQHTAGAGLPLLLPQLLPLPPSSARPLSFAQQRLWFLDQLETRSALYHIPLALYLEGSAAQPLDLLCLQQALNLLVQRHESLRVCLPTRAGQPYLTVLPALTIRLETHDGQNQSGSALEQQLQQHWQTGFDLAQGPLLRASVWQTGPYRHLLLLTLHHIIADGWSIAIWLRELGSLYRALQQNPDYQDAPPAALQYSDFAAWQRQCLHPDGQLLPRQLAYWRQQLQDCPNLLHLPTDRPRPAMPSHRGSSLPVVIAPPLLAGLQQLSRAQQVTLFMTLCAAWQVLLARYSGQSDICIGTPIAGRNQAQTEALGGLFVNTLVLRSQIDLQAPFSHLLAQVRHTTLEAYAHQDLPFEQLLEALQPERHVSYSPLFQVMLALQNTPPATLDLPGIKVSELALSSDWAKFDLSLSLGDGAHGGLQGMLEYSLDLFEPSSMARLLRHFMHLLAAIVFDPDCRVGQLPLMDAAELRVLLDYAPATLPAGCSLVARFEAHAAQHGAAIALEYEQTRLSYAELNARANQLARHLRQLGAGPECLLGICLPRSPQMVLALLAVFKAGAAYLPLDPNYPPARLQFIIEDAQPRLILTQHDLLARFDPDVALFCPQQQADLLATYDSDNLPEIAGPQHLAYVIYTSGSTGKPKGTQLCQAGLSHLLQAWQLPTGARLLQFASFNFDASIWEIGLALSAGATLCLANAPALLPGPALQATLQQMQIDSVILPPVALAMLVPQQLPQVQTIVLGGEACPQALVDAWLADSPSRRIFNAYGPTEATVCSTMYRCQAGAGHQPPIGRALAHVQVMVLDRFLQPQPPGVAGQLYIAGPALTRGYLHRPDLSAASLVPHPFSREPGQRMYASGDLVRQLADGNLDYLGRIDQQVKIRGLRIELGEIESVLAAWPWVREALVLVSGEAGQHRQIVAWLVLAPGSSMPPLSQMRSRLLELLPDYMVPAHFVALDAMPLTPNGKIDRKALPQPDHGSSDAPFQAPHSRSEKLLAEVWGQLLQRQRISVHDDFFALGGHSLLAVQMVSQLQQQGAPAINVRDVFTHGSLGALAAHIDDLHGQTTAGPERDQGLTTAGSALCLPVRQGSGWPALFFIPPIGGEASYAWALAPHLPPTMPLYALCARGLAADETPHTSLQAMAGDYLARMRQIQPQGPYYLAGWSLGGNIAWEIAHQCRQAGQQVDFLGLIDSAPARVLRQQLQAGAGQWDLGQAFLLWLSQQAEITPAAIEKLQQSQQSQQMQQTGAPDFASLLAASQALGLLPAGLSSDLVQAHVALYHASGLAILDWQQPVLDCAVNLYCAGQENRSAWASAEGYGQIDCKLIGGDHFSILQPPLVQQLGRAISADLLARLPVLIRPLP